MTPQDHRIFWRLKPNARIRRFNNGHRLVPEGYNPERDEVLRGAFEASEAAAPPLSDEAQRKDKMRRFMHTPLEMRIQLFQQGSPKVPAEYDATSDLLKYKKDQIYRRFWSMPLEKRIDLYDEGSPLVPEDYYPTEDSLNLLKYTTRQKMEQLKIEQLKFEQSETKPQKLKVQRAPFIKIPMTPQMLHDTWYLGDLIPEAATLFSDEFNARVNKPVTFKVLNNKQNQIVIIAGNDQRLIRFVSFEMGFKILSVSGGRCSDTKAEELNSILQRFNKTLEPIKTRKYVMLGEFEA